MDETQESKGKRMNMKPIEWLPKNFWKWYSLSSNIQISTFDFEPWPISMAKQCCVPGANSYFCSLPLKKLVFCLLQEYSKNMILSDTKMRLTLLTILPLPSLLLSWTHNAPSPHFIPPSPTAPRSRSFPQRGGWHIFTGMDKSVKCPLETFQYFLCMFTSNIQK